VATSLEARRFYVSGFVQGVGYRFFAQRAAAKVEVHGYVKNLFDGRVEVYAIGSEEQLRSLRAELRRGPRGATVEEVAEDRAEMLAEYADDFSIEHGD
jgi:acylphosphatase